MSYRLSLTMSVLAAFVAGPAFAASLHTPFSFIGGDHTPYCIITNVDSKEIEVTATATTLAGSPRTPVVDNCPTPPSTLNVGATCFSYYGDGAHLSCHFTAKGKARASLQIIDAGANVVDTIPATVK
jgi:hypothetical protein